jgi:hypothetical protein
MLKKLRIEVIVNTETEVISMGIAKDGFEESISGDMEIAGLLEHIKTKFLPKVEKTKTFEK